MTNSLAIIGSAGRNTDAARVSRGLYDRMYGLVADNAARWEITRAVSGGAAFADHLAVRAFNEGLVAELTLFLPARFAGRRYAATPHMRNDPGGTTNGYHAAFSSACGLDSLGEIAAAIRKGADVRVHEGFQTRNLEVAYASTHMLAFTFGSASSIDLTPDDEGFQNAAVAGLKITKGTAHCWSEAWKCHLKSHVNLFDLASAANGVSA